MLRCMSLTQHSTNPAGTRDAAPHPWSRLDASSDDTELGRAQRPAGTSGRSSCFCSATTTGCTPSSGGWSATRPTSRRPARTRCSPSPGASTPSTAAPASPRGCTGWPRTPRSMHLRRHRRDPEPVERLPESRREHRPRADRRRPAGARRRARPARTRVPRGGAAGRPGRARVPGDRRPARRADRDGPVAREPGRWPSSAELLPTVEICRDRPGTRGRRGASHRAWISP